MGRVILLGVMALLAIGATLLSNLVQSIVNLLVNDAAQRGPSNKSSGSTTVANPSPPPDWLARGIAMNAGKPQLQGGSRLPRVSAEQDVICSNCVRHFHDGGHHCRCGGWTSSSGYRICHDCARGRTVGSSCRRCESCAQVC